MYLSFIAQIFRPPRPIPVPYRENFFHLFGDIAWFGVLNGSTIAFMSVYAARIGATGDQVGLLGAMGALANLIFTLPAGLLLTKKSIAKSVVWSAILNRIFYLLFVIIPGALFPQSQIWVMIIASLVMSIPLTGVLVGFNALFAEAVPVDWRVYVASIRNALISFTSLVTTLACGQILISLPITLGYQLVFFIGFIGSMISTYHLTKVKSMELTNEMDGDSTNSKPLGNTSKLTRLFRFDILRTNFRRIILLLFIFHLFQYLVIPLFPLYSVNVLGYSDQTISLGMSSFQMIVFLISTQLIKFTKRMNNQVATGIGMILMAGFPAFLPFSTEIWIYLLVSVLSGVGWAIVGSTIYNYILDRMPKNERPAYMSWYNLALNAAILLGSMAGPAIASMIGFDTALWIFAFGRLMSGVAILLWG